jgi:hypothetical protein
MKLVYRGFTTKRRFGAEIEVTNTVNYRYIVNIIKNYTERKVKYEKWAQSKSNDFWHVKQDATCGILGRGHDKGYEIASYVGSGYEDVKNIAQIASILDENNISTNENCGFHVHVEIKDFTPEQVGIMMAYYAKIEWVFLRMLPVHRVNNPYCLPLYFKSKEHKKHFSPLDFWERLHPHKLSTQNNPYRHRSVNLVNYTLGLKSKIWPRSTVEFRLPDCSLLYEDVANWIKFFVNFVEWSKNQEMPDTIEQVPLEQALGFMGLGHEKNTFYLLSHALHETKTWLLERILMYDTSWLANEAKIILNKMWNPVRNYTIIK